jgi:hypothetical protein
MTMARKSSVVSGEWSRPWAVTRTGSEMADVPRSRSVSVEDSHVNCGPSHGS